MTNEIKEILEELKEKNETYKECSENGIIENEYYKSHLLLDYITNLQEEEQEMKDGWQQEVYDKNEILNEWYETQGRIDKAIEYIKEYCIDDEFYINLTNKEKYIFDVLNILQGGHND